MATVLPSVLFARPELNPRFSYGFLATWGPYSDRDDPSCFSSFLANWCRVSADVHFLDFRRTACIIEHQITGKSNTFLKIQFASVIADLDPHGHRR
jgi:hypothetical protein